MQTFFSILLIYVLSFLLGFFYRNILKNYADASVRKRAEKNINIRDRKIRLGIGIVLLIAGVVTGFLPMYFFSGFAFYEAAFTWCGLNALTGKNTCSI